MSNTKENALKFLDSNADIKEVHATEDGFLFVKKEDALNHAKTLNSDDPSVETFKKELEEQKAPRLSVAELKAIKEKAIADFTELFNAAPDEKLSAKEIQKLIDAKKAEKPNPDA